MRPLLLPVLIALAVPAAWAGKAHEHGVARVDIAADPAHVTLLLELPLDSVLGFEHAPQNDAERAQADAALARLKDAATLVRIDPAAQCGAPSMQLESGALGLGGAAPSKDGHDDLDATIDFPCKQGASAGFVELKLFDALPRLKRIDVQAATRKGQFKATLKRPDGRVPLVR